MTTIQFIVVIICFIVIGGAVLVWLARMMNRAIYGQIGESRSWYMTVQCGDGAAIPHDCWRTAIDELAQTDAELIREWGSHAEVGDRANREYRFEDTIVLLELDRWNGFTISGDRELLKPIAERIQTKNGNPITSVCGRAADEGGPEGSDHRPSPAES